MDRRTLLKASVVGAAVGVGAGAGAAQVFTPDEAVRRGAALLAPRAPGQATATRRLSMVTAWPKNLPGLGGAADRLGAMIGELSGGELEVRVYAAGEVVGAFEAFDAVSSGAADMYHAADYYWQGKFPAYPFFTAVPFGMTAMEHMAWIDHGGGQELWSELAGDFNLVPFQAANTAHQMGGWFKREITSLADMRGLKMRIPGLGGEVVRALGGAAVAIPGGEIYGGLQSGLIDAAEWVGPWNDFFLGFYREAPYYYGPGFHEPGASLACAINRQVWESLSSRHQAIMRAACRAVNEASLSEFTHFNAQYLKTLVEQHGVQLRRFPPDVIAAAREASADVRAGAGQGSDLARRIYESFEAARAALRPWSELSDGGFIAMRGAS